ncbi:MAG: efflux RND transporter permease subunit, partial [Candidatus Aminicenantes bacterium]|nr:efflux RND transporter permease subunit [Candidatus Aminicenantes bacterium]
MTKIIERPVLAIIFFTIVILLGIFSLKNTPVELVPEEDLPTLEVIYNWWGASPDNILKKILIPAEEEIMQIKGVEKLKSRSTQNRGTIKVEFTRDTKMNFAEVILRERLNRLQKDLPAQVEKPEIQKNIPEEFKKEPFFKIGVYGKHSIYALRRIADKEIYPYLNSVSGIESVMIWGGVEPQIKIQTNLDKLKRFGISLFEIQQIINQYFFTIQSATLKKRSSEITLSLSESPTRIQDFQNIVIKNFGAKQMRLKEIADIYLGYEELRYEMRHMGMPVIGFIIYKEPNYSSLKLSKKIRQKLQFITNKLNGKVEFIIQHDENKELEDRLIRLLKIAFLILIIIFIILIIIIRDIKATFLIFSSVFFSVFTTFTMIYLFKIPLNLLTLSGLALGFGLFVDNAVVVFDSILRHREKGLAKKEAAVQGARAVILPVLSSTLTTIIVFFSFALFQGRLKLYYLPLAYVITVALISSIVVSFILIPSLGSRINLKVKNSKKLFFRKGKFFPFILRYPLLVILPVICLLFLSYSVFKKEVSFGRFFSWYSKEKIEVNLRFPSGAEFEDVKKTITKFEDLALAKPYEKEITTQIYSGYYRGAHMVITFPEEIEFSAFPLQLKQELVGLATNLAGIGVYVGGFDPEPYYYNPDTGSFLPYNIQVKGYHFEKLIDFSKNIKRSMLNHRRIKDVDIQTDMDFWWGGKEKYFAFKLNREKLRAYRMSPRYLFYLITSVLMERRGTQKLKFNDRELSVEIKSMDVKDLELDDILTMNLENQSGIPFRIKDVVDIELSTQKGGITREDQEYVSMLRWDYLGSSRAGDRYHKTLFKNLKVPVGFKKSLEERKFRITEEEVSQLWSAILLSAIMIYLLLGILYENFFQPLLIMISIPLALIGVFYAFVIMDYTFDSTAYIGCILLGGIVVNNAI